MGRRPAHVRYPMPFSIRLTDFAGRHPGLSMAKSFESDVVKVENGTEQKVLIKMNEPLRHEGLVLFQSSFNQQPGEREVSIFSVVHNPSDFWPLYACIVIGVGLLITFLPKLLKFVRAEPGALPGQSPRMSSTPFRTVVLLLAFLAGALRRRTCPGGARALERARRRPLRRCLCRTAGASAARHLRAVPSPAPTQAQLRDAGRRRAHPDALAARLASSSPSGRAPTAPSWCARRRSAQGDRRARARSARSDRYSYDRAREAAGRLFTQPTASTRSTRRRATAWTPSSTCWRSTCATSRP